MAKKRVFVDTNVIIEAFRVNCWVQLCHAYFVETVEKVVQESLAGDWGQPTYVPVDEALLRSSLSAIHLVDKAMELDFGQKYPSAMRLDIGERHLLTWLWTQGQGLEAHLLLSTADKLAIVMAGQLEWLDQLESLQTIAVGAGVSRSQLKEIRNQFCAPFLTSTRTQVRMGTILGP